MDTNFSQCNDDMEEFKEEICNSMALADAQVPHTHEFSWMLVMLNSEVDEL
jgi:hypothetical protein